LRLIFALLIAASSHTAPKPAPVPAPVASAKKNVDTAAKTRLRPAYPEALLAYAKALRANNQLKPAYDAADQAAKAFDEQLELHRELSEAVADANRGRAERSAARELGQQRDAARFLAAQIAEQMGDENLAIPAYLLVVRSQPDEGLGLEALAALKALGWLRSPAPSKP
jgi:tetratricopeptide (TPR) repeat protein